jgi:hypothetical protein
MNTYWFSYLSFGDMIGKKKALIEAELMMQVMDALNKSIGPAKVLRFLAHFHCEPNDYVEVSKELTENNLLNNP